MSGQNDYNIASSQDGATELHPRTGEELQMGSQAKSTAVYEMVKGMKARGVPIDGVGMQLHVNLALPNRRISGPVAQKRVSPSLCCAGPAHVRLL